VLAFWDREEDGLLGSQYYVNHPLVPLAQTVANVNWDNQGSNLLPNLRRDTFVVGAETGGPSLQGIVRAGNFDDDDVITLLTDAGNAINNTTTIPCDGFLKPGK
jgi:hypothetical protein